MIEGLKNVIKKMLGRRTHSSDLVKNVGEKVIEWPERIVLTLEALKKHVDMNKTYSVADYGSGQQTLRRLIGSNWTYTPYDFYKRTDDTVLINFNEELPRQSHDIIFCLGVFEYLNKPYDLLQTIINNAPYGIISYTAFTNEETRERNGWKNNLTLEDIESNIKSCGAECLDKIHYKNNQWIYIFKRTRS